MKNTLRVLVIGLTFVLMSTIVNGATFVVNTTNDTVDAAPGNGACADASAQCSLRAAISEANALAGDDIITLPAGTYTQTLVAANEDLNAGGDWDVAGNLTINGDGAPTTIIQANAAAGAATERVMNIRSGTVVINGITIRHGRFSGTMTTATRGAGIENLGNLTLNNAVVRDNQISSSSGNPIGAGIHHAGANQPITLNNTTVTANSNVRVTGGSAFGGGMSSIVAATITITNSSISGNSATSQAGGFGFGAGMYLENLFNVTATNSQFNNNTGSGTSGTNGLGVRALSNIGAAVFNATNCTFNNNSSSSATGANQGAGLQLFTTTSAAATLTVNLDRVSINGNSGSGAPGVGINATITGGNMTFNMLNSTLSNNTASVTPNTTGGGINISNSGSVLTSPGTFNFTNSTISGNAAGTYGGGIHLSQPTAGVITVNLNFTTVANNSAVEGAGGIRRTTGTLNIKNSVVADNTGGGSLGPDIDGFVNSQDYNHIENLTGITFGGTTTNNTTGDAVLGTLANNGGSTLTHLPGPGSVVLNTIPNGTNDCGTTVTTDQRGVTRPASGACDKGSVERAVAAVSVYIAGQAASAQGPLKGVLVTISGGGLASPITVQTNSFGYYRFNNILSGQTYTLEVNNKKYTFTPSSRQITPSANVDNENFTADPF